MRRNEKTRLLKFNKSIQEVNCGEPEKGCQILNLQLNTIEPVQLKQILETLIESPSTADTLGELS